MRAKLPQYQSRSIVPIDPRVPAKQTAGDNWDNCPTLTQLKNSAGDNWDNCPTLTRQKRRGYVLLVVIATSVLVITVLSTLAKVSLRRGLQAADAQRALQLRWGAITLERSMTSAIPKLFEAREKLAIENGTTDPPPTTIRAAITLGGVTFDMLLGDEDAKLNVNTIYHHGGASRAEQIIGRSMGPMMPGTIRLIPVVEAMNVSREQTIFADDDAETDAEGDEDEDVVPGLPDAFRSWGEVFDVAMIQRQTGSTAALPNVTTGVTLWGNQTLNIRRASDEAILATVGLVVQDGGARKFLERFRKNPTLALGVILQSEITDEDDRADVAKLLSETSNNFSVWIDASATDGSHLRTFAVTRRDDAGVTRHQRFAF